MPRLLEVTISTSEPASCVQTYLALCGEGVALSGGAIAGNKENIRLRVDDAALVIRKTDGAQGVTGVTILLDGPVGVSRDPEGIELSMLNGLQVQLTSRDPDVRKASAAQLDHVAICVSDLEGSSQQWETLLGIRAHHMGIHPVSNGAFEASRLMLEDRMIELVSPVAGIESRMADRLAARGESVVSLALPVENLDDAIQRLRDLGVRVFEQPPHWFVHPNDAGGVLVQLTPRIEHTGP